MVEMAFPWFGYAHIKSHSNEQSSSWVVDKRKAVDNGLVGDEWALE
jgi:hypothetical protein